MSFPEALPHGSLEEVMPGIHLVTGAMRMMPMVVFDRNMVVVAHPEGLVLFNSLRLDDPGLAALDALGKVTDVVRLGDHHGRDDAFYVDRYGATLWVPEGSEAEGALPLTEASELPIEGAEVFLFEGIDRPEAVVRLPHEGGTLVSCDALQNWERLHPDFGSLGAKLIMWPMGFFRPTGIGAGWRKAVNPQGSCFRRLQRWEYDNVLPSHGGPVLGGAKAKYQATIDAVFPEG